VGVVGDILVELILAGADVWRLQDVRSRPPNGTFETCGAGSLKMPGCGQGGGSYVGLGCPPARSTMELGDGNGRGDIMAAGGGPNRSGSALGSLSGGGSKEGNDYEGAPPLREEYVWGYKDR